MAGKKEEKSFRDIVIGLQNKKIYFGNPSKFKPLPEEVKKLDDEDISFENQSEPKPPPK